MPRIALLSLLACLAGCAAAPFRVVSYNVLVGFGDHRVGDPYHLGAVRKINVIRRLREQRPDVVALQELNGYTTERLEAEARAWGHDHALLLKDSGYATGITSRTPIELVERRLAGMHHGLLHCRTAGIDFVVVHLWPFAGEDRLREVEPALAMAARARIEGRPVILLGDFNAISPDDVDLLGDRALERFRAWGWEEDRGRPRTDVVAAVLAEGYADTWVLHRGEVAEVYPPRVDYVFASAELAERCTGAAWLNEPELLRDSDHPEVIADFRWQPSRVDGHHDGGEPQQREFHPGDPRREPRR